jgi:Uma2 family endonuclease
MSDIAARTTGERQSACDGPILETGDRLTRVDFERRYEATSGLKKAELIEGVVIVPSPSRLRRHSEPHAHIMGWLALYRAATPGVTVADNVSIRLDLDNEPQPDAALLVDPDCGGRSRISNDDYVEGAPELVVEVTSSRVSYDLGEKRDVYRRSGVGEYLVWRVLDREFDWFALREGRYLPQTIDPQGWLHSELFPGLWLNVSAMLRGDLRSVLNTLEQGIASPEHGQFVDRLAQRRE